MAALRRVSAVLTLPTLMRVASRHRAWRHFADQPHFTTAPSLSDRAKKYSARLAESRKVVAPQKDPAADAIRFYHRDQPYFEFTNFYPCDHLTIDGKTYPTTEHYFQAQKFAEFPDLVEKCRELATPRQCFEMVRSQRYAPYVRQDWHTGKTPVKLHVMHTAVQAKFEQNPGLSALLLGTGSRTIIEHTANDNYWGDGGVPDWRPGMQGNQLGQILMKVRANLRQQLDQQV